MPSHNSALMSRPLCMACAAYTVAIALSALSPLSTIVVAAFLLAFAICATLKKLPYFFVTIIVFAAFAGGVCHFRLVEKQNEKFENTYSGRYVTVSGRITDIATTINDRLQIMMETESITALGKTENKNFSACIYTDTEKAFSVGDSITFSDIFTPFKRTSSHSFDSETYFHVRNVSALFSISSGYINSSPGNPSFLTNIRLFAKSSADKVRSLIRGTEGEVAAALTLGDRSGFSDELTNVLSKSGISHIVAVSGMHLSILIGFFFFLAGKTMLHYKIRNIFGIVIVLLYMTLTGFSPSVTRAGIMAICLLLAAIFDRKEDAPTSFFLSAAIILLVNPYTISSASFLLSYAALAGILLLAKPIAEKLSFMPKPLCATIAATLSATITTLPVLVYIFNSVSILSVITNIIVVPLVSTIFILVIITTFIPFCSIFAFIPRILIKYVLISAKIIELIPYSSINIKSPGVLWIICYVIIVILIYRFITGRKCGKPGIIALSFVICTCAVSLSVSALKCSVTFFDIGQGDCALIRLPGYHSCLIDTGPNGTTSVSALKSEGINNIDIIFISHADNDHSGALGDILRNFPTKKVVFPSYDIMSYEIIALCDIATASGADVEFADSFSGYSFANMNMSALWPHAGISPHDRNDGSLVLKLDIKGNTFLFTGDIGTTAEQHISRYADADVLKVSHHGSGDSTSDKFLSSVSPGYSIISAGIDNPYGHPSDETLSRLEKSGSKILRTDLLGDITFDIGLSGSMEVSYGSD